MGLSQLLYISNAIDTVALEDLLAIQEKAIRINARQNITGILFHIEGHYVQFLEGESTAVLDRFEAISRESRHDSVELLYHRPATERYFEEWHMAMLDLELHTETERQNLREMVRLARDYDGNDYAYGPPADLEVIRQFQRLWNETSPVLR